VEPRRREAASGFNQVALESVRVAADDLINSILNISSINKGTHFRFYVTKKLAAY
jgi:hypothetical protein